MTISLAKAQLEDGQLIHQMQVKSFKPLLDKYQDYEINPAAEDLEKVIQKMQDDRADYYLICLNHQPIGAIRMIKLGHDEFKLGPISILPEHQEKGYAQQAMSKVETFYPSAKSFELVTVKEEVKLGYFYEKMGYEKTGVEKKIQDKMTIVCYKKGVKKDEPR